jgi:hypothetical protein
VGGGLVGWWVGLTKQTNCCPMIGPRRPPRPVASFCEASYPVGTESQAALPCGPSCPCAPEADLQDQIGDVDDKIWTSLDPTPQSCRRPPPSFSLSLLNPFLPVSRHIRLPVPTTWHQRPPATTSDHHLTPAPSLHRRQLQPALSP